MIFLKLRETILARRGQPCAVVGSSGVVVAGSKRSTPIVEPPNSILAEDQVQVEERDESPRKRPRPAPVTRDEDWATTLFKTLHNNGSDSGRNFKMKLLLQVQALEMGSDILPPHHGPRTSSSINL